MPRHKGLPVAGYRSQSDNAVECVNWNKKVEETVLRMIDVYAKDKAIDQRWLAIGRSHIEIGFMAINRSIFRPERIKLEGDA